MAEITYLEAIREALFEEMERDVNVFCMGEDIGKFGGAFKVTEGLLDKFGEERVIDSPISEIALVGAAAGAGHMGMRPVVEMQFIDFIANAYDILTNYVATARYRAFLPCPMVVRGPSGGYVRGGPFHSQNPEAGFIHTPGLKVVYPSTAEDAKGLMKAAIRDDDCVLFFEHKYLYRRVKAEMPAGDHVTPIGKARIAREGRDLSIITYASTVWKSLEAADVVWIPVGDAPGKLVKSPNRLVESLWAGRLVVADAIPNPPHTHLIRTAEAAGCTVLDGLGMLVNQGAVAIRLS